MPGRDIMSNNPEGKKPTILQMAGSVLSAIFGVQNNKNRERDFTQGDMRDYIAIFVVIVMCIILGMITLVQLVINRTH